MPETTYTIIRESVPPRRREQLDTFIPELRAGLDAGEMPNARYTKAKEAIGRALETAWVERVRKPYAWNRDYIGQATDAERDLLFELDGAPQTNTLAKMRRNAEKLPDTPAAAAVRALLAEAAPIVELIRDAKAITVKKGTAPKPPTATETYTAPAASGTAMAAVLGELREITRRARESLVETISDQHRRQVNHFMDDYQAHRALPSEERKGRFDIFTWARGIGNGKAESTLMNRLSSCLEEGYDREARMHTFTRRPGMEAIIRARAEDRADAICAQFVDKNMAKLAPIIEGRGDFEKMEVLGRGVNPGAMEGSLRLTFGDKAKFEARTQGVMSFSNLGTPFMRFPLTFHDVRMSNGEKMERPSEKRMNEVFVPDGAPKEEPHP